MRSCLKKEKLIMAMIHVRNTGHLGQKEGLKKNSLEGKIGGDEPYYLSDEAASFETDPDDVDDEGEGEVQQKVKARRRKTQRRVSIEKYVNEPTRVRVKCKKASCPWLLVASYDSRTKDFVVKNYNPVHKCDPTNRNKLCNSKFLAKRFNERIKEQPNIRIFKFQELIRKKLGLYVGRTVCRRAKNIVLNEIMGDHKLEYGRILDYRDELFRFNPGSTCVVKLSEGTFEGGKKIGQLLVAVCKDENNQMLPLAWAVVEIENMHTWRWFVNLLKSDLQLGDGTNLTIITDMQKGLENAIADLLPNSKHRMCARHILANWSKKWRGIERRNYFWRCARSTYE
ncbi:uncharacterized protein [Nicotiana sylvestris]|uniref:uncharacterized protein n=1 Tax=Nicotiana sylvestris TaxID=4096 RepID=UPI00388C91BA